MLKITIICLIYRSSRFAEWVYRSALDFTPMIGRGQCEFLFVANDATQGVKQFLKEKSLPHVINDNAYLSDEELFDRGYGKPEYIHRVYRGWNAGIKAAKSDLVVLVNSDNYFSPDWLEGLLKHYTPNRVVCSQLVERQHPRYPVFPGAIHGEFGNHPDSFDREGFLRFSERVKTTGIRPGGAFMPCLISRKAVEQVGLYPEGNISGYSFDNVVGYGDEVLFSRLRKIGIEQVTSLDSVVYHLKEGEMDDTKTAESTPRPEPRRYVSERVEVADPPKVSVVVTPNGGPTDLATTLESVVAQRFGNWDISVLDSGNSACITELVRSFGSRFGGRAAVLFSGCGDFSGSTIVDAFHKSAGEYLAILPAGTILKPVYLEQIVYTAREAKLGNLFCSAGMEYGASFESLPAPTAAVSNLLKANMIPEVFVIKRELWDSHAGLRPFLPLRLAFWDLFVRSVGSGLHLQTVNRPLYLLKAPNHSANSLDSTHPLGRALVVSLNPEAFECSAVFAAHEDIASAPTSLLSVVAQLRQLHPDEGVLALWQGLIEERQGLLPEALATFRGVAACGGAAMWQGLARLLMLESEQGRLEDARRTARELVRVKPDLPWAQDIGSRLQIS